MEDLTTIVTLLITLSIASERLVEIIKGIVPFLNQKKENPAEEGRRKSALQTMAVAAGITTALLASPMIVDVVPQPWASPLGLLALGLLASGGSGLWNSVLDYRLKIKAGKQLDVDRNREASADRLLALRPETQSSVTA